MVDLNQALRAYQDNRFTDGDVVRCTDLTTRALRELLKVGAVRSVTERRGPGLVRLFDATTFKRAAIIAALNAAGFSLAMAGRGTSSRSRSFCSRFAILSRSSLCTGRQ